ncbi:MAG: 2-C-methyl-D-erythritol 2,4-cyclodiphosphate synthase [Chloroflexi bacterium]|nr:2-C-methyl-D-erythritol 2,4-cyclodiphosphate synthase [Chloroflexota bacterium]
MRVGIGFDVHPLVSGRKLVLGGVEISFSKGLSGHSDADVLTHAIIDALLGASSLGDIGTLFPSSDPKYKDASSLDLLAQVLKSLKAKGWRAVNVDATIVAQRPRLAPFVEGMREQIASVLGVDRNQVSIKAKTSDGLGFVGREEGIAAYAVALIEGDK